ncbi:MAG: HD-GYP domain-containing protein [Acidobacteriota bacterium]
MLSFDIVERHKEYPRSVRVKTALHGELSSAQRHIEALSRAMAVRDPLTHQHSQRVQYYAAALAWEAGLFQNGRLDALEPAGLLHDIGKLAIPDRVLMKPGPLTRAEYDQVKQHTVIGADLLEGLSLGGSLALIVRHHHEHWDGGGYPDGLRGEAIPIGARVLAIADGYDALTSDRPYRRALSHACAVGLIREGLGTMFDPRITAVFLRIECRLRWSRTAGIVTQAQPSGTLSPLTEGRAG